MFALAALEMPRAGAVGLSTLIIGNSRTPGALASSSMADSQVAIDEELDTLENDLESFLENPARPAEQPGKVIDTGWAALAASPFP